MATTDVPPATFAVSSETTGTCHIPDTFHDTLSQGIAALDFARVWNTRGTVDGYRMTAHELEAAAVQFEALARSCRTFSADAVKAGIRAESCKRDSAVGAASNLADALDTFEAALAAGVPVADLLAAQSRRHGV